MLNKHKTKKKKESTLDSTQKWLSIEDIKDGVIKLKEGNYLKIVEVMPVNFKLKSLQEQRVILQHYKAFLKACQFDMQIVVESRKADTTEHVRRIKQNYNNQTNQKVKRMMQDYMDMVQTMSIRKKSISRRFFIVVTYKSPVETDIKNVKYQEIVQELNHKQSKIKEYLSKCGNVVVEHEGYLLKGILQEDNEILNILYTYLNKRLSPLQSLDNKPLMYVNELAPTTELNQFTVDN